MPRFSTTYPFFRRGCLLIFVAPLFPLTFRPFAFVGLLFFACFWSFFFFFSGFSSVSFLWVSVGTISPFVDPCCVPARWSSASSLALSLLIVDRLASRLGSLVLPFATRALTFFCVCPRYTGLSVTDTLPPTPPTTSFILMPR